MSAPFCEGSQYVVDPNGCHQWIRSTTHDGYAHASVGGRLSYCHRVAFEFAHGPIGVGMTVDHLCFNASCINVEHLRELDFLTNSRLQRSAFKTHCVRGHEFTAANTIRRRNGRRRCRTCNVESTRRWRLQKEAS